MLESVDFGCFVAGAAAVVVGERGLFEDYGYEHEGFVRRVWSCMEKVLVLSPNKLFSHVEQISSLSSVDVEKVRNIRYLHEFDRYSGVLFQNQTRD